MAIPLLEYSPSTQNQRVIGYEIAGEEQSRIYSQETSPNSRETDELIWAAYYQIFHEQQMLASNRQLYLESQLKASQITVRDFIRGLATSDSFRRLNYECNNNYRFVELCIQRILGRSVYNEREKLAWSIVLATKGLQGFINALLDTEEYLENFGYNTVPYQRRRILPQRDRGELPFARMSRYAQDYRDNLPKPKKYDPWKNFDLRVFLDSSDGPVVSWLFVTLLGLIVSFYLLPILGILPKFGGY
ncbi:MAG: phycobilisome rod-core linker polypeptide [Nostocaceae cyanobacterium]|nr:phycobilisome rod-core linker polypeptide [Nostocaceae cyanobacterium]